MIEIIVGAGVTAITIPWVIWVTTSLFNQKQELAVLKESLDLNTKIFSLLDDRLK